MNRNYWIWVSDHAATRFVERVIAPYELVRNGFKKNKGFVVQFLKKLSLMALEEGVYDERKKVHIIPWPGEEDVPDIALALTNDHGIGVVKTCWPVDELEDEYWEEE